MDIRAPLRRLDRLQQQRPVFSIPVATAKKFSEDSSARMAAGLAFWAFFSIFPLLMALVTLLGYTVPASDRARVMKSIASYLPLLDTSAVAHLSGNWLALVVGLLGAVWSGLAVVNFAQAAFNAVWEIPRSEQPGTREQITRGLFALVVIGGGLIAATFLVALVLGSEQAIDLGAAGRITGFALSIAIDVGVFVAAFRILTHSAITLRDVVPGAVFAGGVFWLLQSLSSVIITRHLNSAQRTYGEFATVITMLWWFYMQSMVTLYGAQANVVLRRHHYPRALFGPEGPAEPKPAPPADSGLVPARGSDRVPSAHD